MTLIPKQIQDAISKLGPLSAAHLWRDLIFRDGLPGPASHMARMNLIAQWREERAAKIGMKGGQA